MPDPNARAMLIAEAEWRVTAAECRLLLAMRNRAEPGGDPGPAPIGRLIDELEQADARLRFAFGPPAIGRGEQEPDLDVAYPDSDSFGAEQRIVHEAIADWQAVTLRQRD